MQLWLHSGDHRVGVSALTSVIQRQKAKDINSFPWGNCDIPDELAAEVSSDDEAEVTDASDESGQEEEQEEQEEEEHHIADLVILPQH